jgi:hypothetical protein
VLKIKAEEEAEAVAEKAAAEAAARAAALHAAHLTALAQLPQVHHLLTFSSLVSSHATSWTPVVTVSESVAVMCTCAPLPSGMLLQLRQQGAFGHIYCLTRTAQDLGDPSKQPAWARLQHELPPAVKAWAAAVEQMAAATNAFLVRMRA